MSISYVSENVFLYFWGSSILAKKPFSNEGPSLLPSFASGCLNFFWFPSASLLKSFFLYFWDSKILKTTFRNEGPSLLPSFVSGYLTFFWFPLASLLKKFFFVLQLFAWCETLAMRLHRRLQEKNQCMSCQANFANHYRKLGAAGTHWISYRAKTILSRWRPVCMCGMKGVEVRGHGTGTRWISARSGCTLFLWNYTARHLDEFVEGGRRLRRKTMAGHIDHDKSFRCFLPSFASGCLNFFWFPSASLLKRFFFSTFESPKYKKKTCPVTKLMETRRNSDNQKRRKQGTKDLRY